MGRETGNNAMEDRTTADVERIRDIIFGSQIRQYDQRFSSITQQIDRLDRQLDELRSALDEQRLAGEARAHEIEENLTRRTTELDRTLSDQISQVDAASGQRLAQMQTESRQSLDALSSEMSSRIKQQNEDLTTQLRQLAADLRQQERDLRSEFTAALNALEDEKISRHNLGDLLMEVAMRLKGDSDIGELLQELGAAADQSGM
ncbi:MAG: hypothetical protein GX601_09645 [Anaerolineales bacterium]|nr:hypothetical protein [Anaerolineales bacterium]